MNTLTTEDLKNAKVGTQIIQSDGNIEALKIQSDTWKVTTRNGTSFNVHESRFIPQTEAVTLLKKEKVKIQHSKFQYA